VHVLHEFHGGALPQVVNHTVCTYFVNAMVVLSCVILMLDVVSLDPKSTRGIVLRNLDAATTAVFGMEVRRSRAGVPAAALEWRGLWDGGEGILGRGCLLRR